MKVFIFTIGKIATGFLNGVFGSGGGIIAVISLNNRGLSQKQSQATAMFITYILSLVTVGYYIYMEYFTLKDSLIYVPFGIPGALTGSYLLNKISDKTLKKAFALLIIFAGIRMING